MTEPTTDQVAQALEWISPEDRDTWVLMAMACCSALGDDGWRIWNHWSQGSDKYRPRDAVAVWRSVRSEGGVTVGSLFEMARRAGWRPNAAGGFRPHRQRTHRSPPVSTGPSHEEAAARAEEMMAEAKLDTHPYLARKGFPDHKMLVLGEALLVPMRPIEDYTQVSSLQLIRPDGSKRFLKGGRASGCVYCLGSGYEQWWCEGLATGLSVLAALDTLYRRARVTVCFSASNLAKAARRGIVIADHDANSGAGEKAARATGLRWWMPPEPGDANDFHQAHGVEALAQELRRVQWKRLRVAA